jgi:hypothetical protein
MNVNLEDTKRYRDNPLHAIVFSIDLGRQEDFTAWCVAEMRPQSRRTTRGKRYLAMSVAVRDLVRLPIGTPYDEIQQIIHDEFWSPEWWLIDQKSGRHLPPQMVIDSGGPGWPVVDNLARGLDLGRHIISYALTKGSANPRWISPQRFTVPRSTVFQQLYAAASNELVGVDPRLNHATTLIGELKNLRREPSSEEGYERIVHRSGEHDDLAIATGTAIYLANEQLKKRQKGRGRLKIMDTSATEEIDPHTGVSKRKGQDLRRKRLEERAKQAGIAVGGPGLASARLEREFTPGRNPRFSSKWQ